MSEDENIYNDSIQDLDISWIQEHEKETNISENFFREPVENISIYYLYINNSEIEKIDNELVSTMSVGDSIGLSKERILHIIQHKKNMNGKKYKISEILLYNVLLEPESIQSYSKSENTRDLSKGFFKTLSIFDDIIISDSIFIFHSINSIYFIFQRNEVNRPRSILKDKTRKHFENSDDGSGGKHSYTKKSVAFDLSSSHSTTRNKRIANKITRKNINIL